MEFTNRPIAPVTATLSGDYTTVATIPLGGRSASLAGVVSGSSLTGLQLLATVGGVSRTLAEGTDFVSAAGIGIETVLYDTSVAGPHLTPDGSTFILGGLPKGLDSITVQAKGAGASLSVSGTLR